MRRATLLDREDVPDSKVHGAIMGLTWGRQDPGGPDVGPMNFAIWGGYHIHTCYTNTFGDLIYTAFTVKRPLVNTTATQWWNVKPGLGVNLVPSGKLLFEIMLIQPNRNVTQ